MGEQFRRKNHYVPSLYLCGFADESGRIFNYPTLVSNPNIPTWKSTSPAGAGYLAHLYTHILGGKEADDFERWLDHDFESPAAEPISKAINELPLSAAEWRVLARFAAAQAVRTPAFFVRQQRRWHEQMPKLLESVLRDTLEDMRARRERGEPAPASPPSSIDLLPVGVSVEPADDPALMRVTATTIVGRDMWLFNMREILTNTIENLEQHRWTILKPHRHLSWFTSDDPVLCVNYYRDGSYDFGGGWGTIGSEICLPLSPRHLLYAKVGKRPPRRGTALDGSQTNLMRRLIAEHAFRAIFAGSQHPDMPKIRPRQVDAQAFQRERRFWRDWHTNQSLAVAQLAKNSPDSGI